MKHRVITVSREFCSRGSEIGSLAAAELGIPCHDSDIIDKLAESTEFARDFIAENGEYAVYRSRLFELITARDFTGQSAQDRLYAAQAELIRQFASEGSCVIVGRCAEYVLRDRCDLLRVFVRADMASRIDRLAEKKIDAGDSPEQYLKDRDARRKAYYYAHTDIEWGAGANYDITLNSSLFGAETCAGVIAKLYRKL